MKKLRIGLEEMIYAFDSSTIELCLKLCPWAEFHHGKSAFKVHTLMDLRGSIPAFVLLTQGKVNDAKVMDKIPVEAGAFYLMDKGYVAFEKLYKFFQQKVAYFVTRAKDNISYEVIESRPTNKDAGVLSDETIRLIGYYSRDCRLMFSTRAKQRQFPSSPCIRLVKFNFLYPHPATSAGFFVYPHASGHSTPAKHILRSLFSGYAADN